MSAERGRWSIPFLLLLGGCQGTLPLHPATVSVPVPMGSEPGPISPFALELSSTTVGTPIDSRFAGLSFEKGMLFRTYFDPANPQAVTLFELLGKGLVRIGGGSCDQDLWNPSGAGKSSGEIAPSDVDRLAAFASATGWDVLYCVNLANSTPSAAANEASYAAQALGSHLVGIEIGNEPVNYPTQFPQDAKFQSGWGPSQYLSLWTPFAQAIHSAVPSLPITGPALPELNNDSKWVPPVLGASPAVSLLTQHYYVSEDVPAGTIETVLSAPGVPFGKLAALEGLSPTVPWRMAETNSFWGGGIAGVSDSFASALWAIDYLFAIARHKGTGANFHTRSPNVSSVILDQNGTITAVRPIYYGILLFSMAGPGEVLDTTQDAGGLNVTAYALRRADGSNAIFLLNQTASTTLSFSIGMGRPVTTATERVLTAPSAAATEGVTIQGSAVGIDGSFSPAPSSPLLAGGESVSGLLGPASAALIEVP